nr:hypothetical protein CFP56_70113 [Quercus suber]
MGWEANKVVEWWVVVSGGVYRATASAFSSQGRDGGRRRSPARGTSLDVLDFFVTSRDEMPLNVEGSIRGKDCKVNRDGRRVWLFSRARELVHHFIVVASTCPLTINTDFHRARDLLQIFLESIGSCIPQPTARETCIFFIGITSFRKVIAASHTSWIHGLLATSAR